MPQQSSPATSTDKKSVEGSFLEGIPGHFGTLGLGLLSFGMASIAYLPELNIVALVDIPLTFVCFVTASLIGIGSREKQGLVLTGVIFAGLGLALAAMHLVLQAHSHPWLN